MLNFVVPCTVDSRARNLEVSVDFFATKNYKLINKTNKLCIDTKKVFAQP